MNKKQLIAAMAEKTGLKLTEAGKALDAFVDVVVDALKEGDSVQLVGFCSLQVAKRAARQGINPQDKSQKITIPAKKVVKFKAGKALVDAIQ
ncbi:MAG: HU family DNA-binding protein [Christensenellales bacterium]